MTTRQFRHSILPRLILPAVAAAYLAYFGFWAFHGHYGVWAKTRLEGEATELQAELAALKEQRRALEHRVKLLRPESIDPDMLDEQARQALNFLRPNEVVLDSALQQRTR
jgi:cell division protein FtsB